MRRAVSWVLAVLAAVALMVSVVATFATREVFDADRFAARTEQALQTEAVSAEVARRLTDAVITAQPDLVAVRPLVLGAAEGVVRSAAFGAVVRGSVRDLHRSAFDADAGTVTLTVVDAGLLVSEALDRLRPDLAARIPDTVRVTLTDTADGPPLALLQAAEDAKWLAWIALVVALLAGAAAVLVGAGGEASGGGGGARRAAAMRVGAAVAACAGLTALVATAAPHVVTGDAAVRAVLDTWLDPLAVRCWVVCAGALLVTTAAAAVWQPPAPGALRARVRGVADRVPPTGRAVAAIAFGAVALAAPLVVLRVAVMVAGALAVLWGTAELLRRVAPPATAPPRPRGRPSGAAGSPSVASSGAAGSPSVAPSPGAAGSPAAPASSGAAASSTVASSSGAADAPRSTPRFSPRRLAVGAGALVVAAGTLAFSLSATQAQPVRVGKCNGSAALCARTLDQVAFVGTHNSMSADGEPGWLFPAQNAGIAQQLDDGVRALLIDTHYGFQTARGVATDLDRDSKSREKVTSELGEEFIDTALRLRTRMGYQGGGTAEIFLCHAFCEVGATKAVDALKDVHEFLVQHPEEVLILSIEDDTDPADTAKLIRDSGLIREVYHGPAKPPWPTLEQMIERNERVLVLIENEPGEEPWMHPQDQIAQETPYRFTTAAALQAPDSCAPNRGGDAGSLLLVNHWVDTSPAPRKTIARAVNARAVLGARLERCQQERKLLPNIVAVDFYRDGDVFPLVEELR